MLPLFLSFAAFVRRRREQETLRKIREEHICWNWLPYGETVQIKTDFPDNSRPIGTVGRVLGKKEHGIRECPCYTLLSSRFPGVRGYHFLVDFGDGEPEVRALRELAPAYTKQTD